MVDTETLAPLCKVYDSPNYTQEMQEFLKKLLMILQKIKYII